MSLELDDLDLNDEDKTQAMDLEQYGVWVKKTMTPEDNPETESTIENTEDVFISDSTEAPAADSTLSEEPVPEIIDDINSKSFNHITRTRA